MKTGRFLFLAALAGITLLGTYPPVRAQEGQVKGRIIIHGPDGDREIELDPSQLPPPGAGGNVIIMRAGPDGQVFTFGGDPGALGMFGPGGLMFGGPGGGFMGGLSIIDPGRSYIHQLIKRDDVRSELFITSQQREALEAAEKQQQTAQQQGFQALTGDLQGKSPDELRSQLTEQAKQIKEQMQNLADAKDKQLASILTPKQMNRLKELDLQFRGPLALGVKPVGDLVKLTPEQSPKEADLLKQYRQEVSQKLGFGARTASFNTKGGAAPAQPNPPSQPASPAEAQARMEKAQREIEQARKALGEKALQSVTGEQRTQWSSLTGKTFKFRAVN